jgi:hypothetical protein
MSHSITSISIASLGLAMLGSPAFGQSDSGQFNTTPQNLRASKLVGATAQTASGEKLGAIRELMVDPQTGEIRMAILGESSLSGLSGKWVPIPWEAMSQRSAGQFTVNLDRQQIESGPTLQADDYTALQSSDLMDRVNRHYQFDRSQSGVTSRAGFQDSGFTQDQSDRSRFSRSDDERYRATPERYNQGQSQSGIYGQGSRSGTFSDADPNRQQSYRSSQDRDYGGQDQAQRYFSDRSYAQGSPGRSDYDSGRYGQGAAYTQDRYYSSQDQSRRYDSDHYGQGTASSDRYYGQGTYSGSPGRPKAFVELSGRSTPTPAQFRLSRKDEICVSESTNSPF